MEERNHLKEVCKNCGLTKGAHSAASFYSDYYRLHVPHNYCPGHQSRMDWDKGPGTTFEPTGLFKEIKYGTPATKETIENGRKEPSNLANTDNP